MKLTPTTRPGVFLTEDGKEVRIVQQDIAYICLVVML